MQTKHTSFANIENSQQPRMFHQHLGTTIAQDTFSTSFARAKNSSNFPKGCMGVDRLSFHPNRNALSGQKEAQEKALSSRASLSIKYRELYIHMRNKSSS